jgi:hypothetical protein
LTPTAIETSWNTNKNIACTGNNKHRQQNQHRGETTTTNDDENGNTSTSVVRFLQNQSAVIPSLRTPPPPPLLLQTIGIDIRLIVLPIASPGTQMIQNGEYRTVSTFVTLS